MENTKTKSIGREKLMYILGLACHYHDSSACLVKDGIIIAAAEEERFTRKKHDASYPINAINLCIEFAGITEKDIDHIIFYEKPMLKVKRILSQHLEMAPFSYESFAAFMASWLKSKIWIKAIIRKSLNYKGKIHFMEHHQAHAASSFFTSPFTKAAFLTADGVGELTTTSCGIGKENKITITKEIDFPHSLGLLYSTITAYLGFTVNNSEYKVMGLSPYGNPHTFKNAFTKLLHVRDDGSFELDMQYFDFHYKMQMPSKKMCELFGGPISERNCEMTQKHKDIAAALQKRIEEVIFKILTQLHKETKEDNLVLSGGCALNSIANGKILQNTPFKNIYIQPAAGDGGNSIGAALFCYNQILGNKKRKVQNTAYLGPEYSDKNIQIFLDKNSIKYTKFENKRELVKKTAKLIFDNLVIGWFQGRMEWGPRALGARSILSNACNKDMQEILNLKVKHREKFRPFAPVVCEDDALTYFECDNPIPMPTDFMLMVYPIRKQYQTKIPAVTHVDGSGRLQTIRRFQNPNYYELIKEFGKLSDIPILINTSFNIRGEPIVCEPEDAYICMMGTEIDYLVMGNFLVKRNDNPDDKWDSEVLAND